MIYLRENSGTTRAALPQRHARKADNGWSTMSYRLLAVCSLGDLRHGNVMAFVEVWYQALHRTWCLRDQISVFMIIDKAGPARDSHLDQTKLSEPDPAIHALLAGPDRNLDVKKAVQVCRTPHSHCRTDYEFLLPSAASMRLSSQKQAHGDCLHSADLQGTAASRTLLLI